MAVYQDIIEISTEECEITDITHKVQNILDESRFYSGIVNVFNVGSTAAISTIEFENGLVVDFPKLMEKLIPSDYPYEHDKTWGDNNGHSHLRSTLMGPSISIPFSEGKIILGTWQQVIHIEFDHRPRKRQIVVTIYGEPYEPYYEE